MKQPQLNILGPDSIYLSPSSFNSYSEALAFLAQWVKRYEKQGHYTTAGGFRIALKDLPIYCVIINTNQENN